MGTLTVSRKQRLRTLEKEIRSGMEEFYYVGMKLKEIRDEELYKEDGFGTWERYCKERWDWDRTHVHNVITSAEYREKLPMLASGQQKWTERAVREFRRIPDKRQAAWVAEKIVKEVEKSHKEAAKDPDQKPLKLSASTVRKFVDEDLGIDRAAKAKATKATDKRPELRIWLDRQTGAIEGILDALQHVPDDAWTLLSDSEPQLVKRFTTACKSLVAFLRKVEG